MIMDAVVAHDHTSALTSKPATVHQTPDRYTDHQSRSGLKNVARSSGREGGWVFEQAARTVAWIEWTCIGAQRGANLWWMSYQK
jgi:hypothetical protein